MQRHAGDKWFVSAYKNTDGEISDGTYEAVGPYFKGNPHRYFNKAWGKRN